MPSENEIKTRAKKIIQEMAASFEKKEGAIIYVDPDELLPPLVQREINREALESLKESIKKHGILHPIVVRRLPDGRLRIVGGHHRAMAAKELGIKAPVFINEAIKDEKDEIVAALQENLERADMSLRDIAKYIEELERRGIPRTKIPELTGGKISKNMIYRIIWTKELPEEIQEMIFDGRLPLRAAEVLHKAKKKLLERDEPSYAMWNTLIEQVVAFPEDYEKTVKEVLELDELDKKLKEFAEEIAREAKEKWPEYDFQPVLANRVVKIMKDGEVIASVPIYDTFRDEIKHKDEVLSTIEDIISWETPEEEEEEEVEEEEEAEEEEEFEEGKGGEEEKEEMKRFIEVQTKLPPAIKEERPSKEEIKKMAEQTWQLTIEKGIKAYEIGEQLKIRAMKLKPEWASNEDWERFLGLDVHRSLKDVITIRVVGKTVYRRQANNFNLDEAWSDVENAIKYALDRIEKARELAERLGVHVILGYSGTIMLGMDKKFSVEYREDADIKELEARLGKLKLAHELRSRGLEIDYSDWTDRFTLYFYKGEVYNYVIGKSLDELIEELRKAIEGAQKVLEVLESFSQ